MLSTGIYEESARAHGNQIIVTFPETVQSTDTVKLYFYNFSYINIINKADLIESPLSRQFVSHLPDRWGVDNRTGSQLVNCANPAGVTPTTTTPTTGGGSRTGGGGGGGAPTSRDQHGNTVSRAADVTLDDLMSSTPAVINSRTDVDYFSFDIPNDGLFLVNTTGSAHTTGKMWQQVDGELELLSEGEDTGSLGRNFEMKSKVKAGTVIVLVEGKNQRTGSYNLHTDLILGYLENPGPGSKKSGVGVISGWTCDAEDVEVEIDGTRVMRAAYGTERLDTEVVCEDTDNGFGLLFNWNLLDRSQKEHTARLLVDGEELDRTTFTVTTLGEEFVRGVSGETRVNDFPSVGEMFRLVWQQALQNFTLAPLELPEIGKKPRASLSDGVLENPHHASLQSGIGVISGWICDAESVHVEIDGEKNHVVSYGTERTDTMGVCGDTNNGFGLLINWNNLEDGVHTAKLFADGEVVDETQFVVTTLGQEFLRGAQKTVKVTDFPEGGQETTLEWQQNEQNFVITNVMETTESEEEEESQSSVE